MMLYFEVLFFSVVMIAIAVFGSCNMHDTIDDRKFKRVKVVRHKFLFRAINYQSVENHGIIIPLFIIQLLAYPLSLCNLIVGVIIVLSGKNPTLFCAVMLGAETGAFVITTLVLSFLSRIRK